MESIQELFSGHLALPKGVSRGRGFTRDNLPLTFDRSVGAMDSKGNAIGKPLPRGCMSHDGKVYDSTGAFLVGELERLDMKLHEPLVAVSYLRDIKLREDVTIADEVSSYTISTFASAGGLGTGNGIGNGKAWAGKNTTQVTSVSVDIAKLTNPLHIWAAEVKYDVLELESAAKLGRPVDEQKWEAMKLKREMDIDEQVYYGDTGFADTGLINNGAVTPTNVAAGASGFTQWVNKSADEILGDVNAALTTVWANSAWAVMPTDILIPPNQYGYISTQKVSQAGNVSILRYLLENNLIMKSEGKTLDIKPVKWAIGAGVGGTIGAVGNDRMVVYTNERDRVRFPMTTMASTPIQYDGLYHKRTYYMRIGRVELVYPQTVGYFDQI